MNSVTSGLGGNSKMDGILIVNKPQGITSHDVVDFIRRRFRIKKVGHAGTLDPLATGVLVMLIGRATKISGKLTAQDKEYEVIMTLGKRTDTGDADGKVICENDNYASIGEDRILEVFDKFVGEISQIPPMTSAVKYKGKKLYELARKGIEVERPARTVTIRSLSLVNYRSPDIELNVQCSKGTYVRVLCDDIGLVLGCGGYVSKIKRLKSGDFAIEDAIGFDKLRDIKRYELGLLLKNENYYRFKTA